MKKSNNKARKEDERRVLEILQELYPDKYKDAYLTETPDIQTDDKSIGVEIVRADDEKLILTSKTIGKNIINAKSMMGDKPLSKFEIQSVLKYRYLDKFGKHMSLQEAQKCKYFYKIKNDGKESIKEIIDYDDLEEKSKKYKIWEARNSEYYSLNENYIVVIAMGHTIWEASWDKIFIDRIDSKIEKFDTYNKFDENNLAVISKYPYDNNFELVASKLEQYYKDKYMPFDKIYLMCWQADKTKVINFNY